MGGAQAGELASGLAAAALRDETSELTGGEQRVDDLIQEANRRVYQRQSQDASASGMGTTMTVALVEDGRVAIGHVGDSRAYLIRDRKLEQLTEDHSLVAELVRSGKLSPEEAERPPAAVRDHARARHRPGRRRRHVLDRDQARRPLPALLGRAHLDGRRPDDPARGRAQSRRPPGCRESARPRGEQGRRRGQHHGRLLRDRGRRRARGHRAHRRASAGRGRRRGHARRAQRRARRSRSSTATRTATPAAVRSSRCSRCSWSSRSAAARSGASGARTSSAPRATATSSSTRACRGTWSAASSSTAPSTSARCSPRS